MTFVNLSDPSEFSKGIPHAGFKKLRQARPVYWTTPSIGNGFWSLTRYEDIQSVNRDTQTFSSAQGIMAFEGTTLGGPDQPRMMIEMDAPQHTRYRRLVNRGFTAGSLKQLEPIMRDAAQQAINAVKKHGTCDFVEDIAATIPMKIITDMMGCPSEDQRYLMSLSDQINSVDESGTQSEAIQECCRYARAIAQQKCPMRGEKNTQDLCDILLSADIDGEKLTDSEFDLFFLLLMVAGNETTRTAIAHGILAFSQNPDQWALLQSNPNLLDNAVNEILRWSTPVLYMARTATQATTIRDQSIAKGDKVVLWYGSANFDETVFEKPLQFDITRNVSPQIAFGAGGPHYCLGANLALLEIKVLLSALLCSWADFELDDEVTYLRSNFSNAITGMPLRFRPLQQAKVLAS